MGTALTGEDPPPPQEPSGLKRRVALKMSMGRRKVCLNGFVARGCKFFKLSKSDHPLMNVFRPRLVRLINPTI